MCEANAYLVGEEREELLLEAVDLVEPVDENQWRLVSIFGGEKNVEARVSHPAFAQHKNFFKQTAPR